MLDGCKLYRSQERSVTYFYIKHRRINILPETSYFEYIAFCSTILKLSSFYYRLNLNISCKQKQSLEIFRPEIVWF